MRLLPSKSEARCLPVPKRRNSRLHRSRTGSFAWQRRHGKARNQGGAMGFANIVPIVGSGSARRAHCMAGNATVEPHPASAGSIRRKGLFISLHQMRTLHRSMPVRRAPRCRLDDRARRRHPYPFCTRPCLSPVRGPPVHSSLPDRSAAPARIPRGRAHGNRGHRRRPVHRLQKAYAAKSATAPARSSTVQSRSTNRPLEGDAIHSVFAPTVREDYVHRMRPVRRTLRGQRTGCRGAHRTKTARDKRQLTAPERFESSSTALEIPQCGPANTPVLQERSTRPENDLVGKWPRDGCKQ